MELTVDRAKTTCQTDDVAKGPFKGKGEVLPQMPSDFGTAHTTLAGWEREAKDKLEAVYRDMRALRDESKTVADRTFSVDLYSLSHRGSKSLRWRHNNGTHLTWDKVVPLLADMPPAMAQWYRELQARMLFINAREQVSRHQLKITEGVMAAIESQRLPKRTRP